MKCILKYLFTLIAILGRNEEGILFAQNYKKVDSFQNRLNKLEAHKKEMGAKANPLMDTTRANILDSMAMLYWLCKPDTALVFAREEQLLSEKIGYKKGFGNAYRVFAVANYYYKNYPLALDYYQKSLNITESIGYIEGSAWTYNDIAILYYDSCNYKESLNYFYKSLKLFEQLNSKPMIADIYKNIGDIYRLKEINYEEALKNYSKSLKVYEEMGDTKQVGWAYFCIAFCYGKLGNHPLELENNLMALKVYENMNDGRGIMETNENIGVFYCDVMHQYELAIKYINKSLRLAVSLQDSTTIYITYCNRGGAYFHQGNYKDALNDEMVALQLSQKNRDSTWISWSFKFIGDIYFAQAIYDKALSNYMKALEAAKDPSMIDQASWQSICVGATYEKLGNLPEALKYESQGLSMAFKSGEKDAIKDAYGNLAIINKELHNYKAAYEDEVLFKKYYDSTYNIENEKKYTSLQMQYEFDKKQDSLKSIQVKKDALHFKELENQKRIRNYILAGLGIVLFFLVYVFIQRNKIAKEKKRSEALLLNILPAEVAEELKNKGYAEPKSFDDVTVIFTDFVNFTKASEHMSPRELVNELDCCFKAFDDITAKNRIEKIKTIGDSYLAVAGLPLQDTNHAENVVGAALEINAFIQDRVATLGNKTFEIRIGINSGSVVAGIVGVKKFAYDIWGDTVNTAARMEQHSAPGKVNISQSTYELVKDKFHCEYRGEIEAKGKGKMGMYFVNV